MPPSPDPSLKPFAGGSLQLHLHFCPLLPPNLTRHLTEQREEYDDIVLDGTTRNIAMRFFQIPSPERLSSRAAANPSWARFKKYTSSDHLIHVEEWQSGTKPSRSTPFLTFFAPHHPPKSIPHCEDPSPEAESIETGWVFALHRSAASQSVWASNMLLRVAHYFRCRC